MSLPVIKNSELIIYENINQNQYTLSLLKEGLRTGLVDKKVVDGIQAQVMFILKDLIIRYTRGESTSVTIETAERLLNSIYYSIDAYMKSLHNVEEGIAYLKFKSIKEAYEKGIGIIVSCVEEARALFTEMMKNKLSIPLRAYNDTIDTALPDFFKKYDIMFNAHDTMADIDYPLVFDDTDVKGIFYIKQYLEKLNMETQFCSVFSNKEIVKVLKNYGRICGVNYTEPLVNIFELMINNAILTEMAGNDFNTLWISKFQQDILYQRLSSLSPGEISTLTDDTVEKVLEDCGICSNKLKEYVDKYKSVFIVRLINAMENHSLDKLILVTDEKKQGGKGIIFDEGERMNDADFRAVIAKIMKCMKTQDKVDIIISSVHSVGDLVDVMEGDCLYKDEYYCLFNTLSDLELALIGVKVFCEEMRNGSLNLSTAIRIKKDAAAEKEWVLQYMGFIRGLETERIRLIENNINYMFVPED